MTYTFVKDFFVSILAGVMVPGILCQQPKNFCLPKPKERVALACLGNDCLTKSFLLYPDYASQLTSPKKYP